MFDWDDLRHFLAVARQGSTLAAGKSLRVSQSTVHRRLAVLENKLGRRLFKRQPSGYQLTKLGQEMLPYAEGVEASAADFERHFMARDPDRGKKVRVSCPASAAHRLMTARLLDKFREHHPGLSAEFVMTEEFFDLAQGEVDLAIWQGEPQDKALIARKIADVPWAVFASKSYVAKRGRPTLEDMSSHAVVEFGGPMKNHAAALWQRAAAPGAAIAARGNSVSEIMSGVKSGAGMAPLPVPFAMREEDLVMVIESRPDLTFSFYVVIHRDMRQVRRVRAFLDFLIGQRKLIHQVLERGAPITAR